MKNTNYLLVIIGPTGIGKTALSIALAAHYNCEIISSDSRQFFKEMQIGTAVPSSNELQKIKHHFIQSKSIFENYTVGDFEKEAIQKLDELFLKNNIQIMVGGSGLYNDAVLKGLDRFPEIDFNIREAIRVDFEKLGIVYLQQQLMELDKTYFSYLTSSNPQTLQNPQRMMRFLEVCRSTKMPYSSFLNSQKKDRNFTPIIIGLTADRIVMYNRINERVDQMIQNGLVQEVTSLYRNRGLNALQTVGYSEIFKYIDNEYSLNVAIEEIKKNTRRFSKRQVTWFKRTQNVLWFDYASKINCIIEKIEDQKKVLKLISTFFIFIF